jgi:hypothetical protein
MSCEQCGKDIICPDQNYCIRCGFRFTRVDECPICYEKDTMKVLPCGHTVCQSKCASECINKCPLCCRYFNGLHTTLINICNHCFSNDIDNNVCKNCELYNITPITIDKTIYNSGCYKVKSITEVNPIRWVSHKKCGSLRDFKWNLKGSTKCPHCKDILYIDDVKIRPILYGQVD